MSIGFPTGDWCRSPSFAKTTPNMFKGRLNREERSAAHNWVATYISATHSASSNACFTSENAERPARGGGWIQSFYTYCDDYKSGLTPITSRLIVKLSDVNVTEWGSWGGKKRFKMITSKLTDWIIHFHGALDPDRAWHCVFNQLVDRLYENKRKAV